MAIDLSTEEKSIWKICNAVVQLIQGRSNAVGQITLTPGTTTTVITKQESPAAVNVAVGSQVFLTPLTANAAAALATTYISAIAQSSFTVKHANNAQIDRLFGWRCDGGG